MREFISITKQREGFVSLLQEDDTKEAGEGAGEKNTFQWKVICIPVIAF